GAFDINQIEPAAIVRNNERIILAVCRRRRSMLMRLRQRSKICGQRQCDYQGAAETQRKSREINREVSCPSLRGLRVFCVSGDKNSGSHREIIPFSRRTLFTFRPPPRAGGFSLFREQ